MQNLIATQISVFNQKHWREEDQTKRHQWFSFQRIFGSKTNLYVSEMIWPSGERIFISKQNTVVLQKPFKFSAKLFFFSTKAQPKKTVYSYII